MNDPRSRFPSVAVIGAGIVGATAAFELASRGAGVTLVDRGEPGHGCSFGNLGAISEGSVVPLATPGVLRSLPSMLRDPQSPLRVVPGYLPRALPWLVRFALAARRERVGAIAGALASLHRDAVARHRMLAASAGVPELVVERGHLFLYPEREAFAAEKAAWTLRARHGIVPELLERDAILALEPNVPARYRFAAFLPGHATIVNPARYVSAIVRAFTARGGRLVRAEVNALAPPGARHWRVMAGEQAIEADHVIVAAGAWSRRLLDPLGVHLPLETQRGYHVQYRGAAPISRTVVLSDRKIFFAPMEDGLRAGGTVEIAGLAAPADPRRSDALRRIAEETFGTRLDRASASVWMGHRPCMPNSLPRIGAAAGLPGLWLAVGHGHLGLTDAPATASRIADALMRADAPVLARSS